LKLKAEQNISNPSRNFLSFAPRQSEVQLEKMTPFFRPTSFSGEDGPEPNLGEGRSESRRKGRFHFVQ